MTQTLSSSRLQYHHNDMNNGYHISHKFNYQRRRMGLIVNFRLMRGAGKDTATSRTTIAGGSAHYIKKDSQGNDTSSTYSSLLQACADSKALVEGRQVHAQIIKTDQNVVLGNNLIIMYVKCGSLVDARRVFDGIPKGNLLSWAAMIGGYARHGCCETALAFYYQMLWTGMKPNNFIFPCVLKACAHLSVLQKGKAVHDHIIRSGFESDVFVRSALVDMYAKCGRIEDARLLFDKMSQRDVVLWNTMIVGYVHNGQFDEALRLFCQMQLVGVESSPVTLTSVLSACASLAVLEQGQKIHGYVIRSGFESHVFVGNALMDMYVNCGSVEVARHVFDKMPQRDVISWNTMIAGYVHVDEALKIFLEMQLAGVQPDLATISSVLSACASLSALEEGKEIHDYIIRHGTETNVYVESALVAMYAKCDSIYNARRLFDKMSRRNLVTWNAMITGYVQNGHGDEALKLFWQMRKAGMKPDSVTIASVLSACAELAALEQGKRIHDYVVLSGVELDGFLGSALVAMYAKCGSIEEAGKVFHKISHISPVSWNAMIAGCAQNGYASEALKHFRLMQQLGMTPNLVTVSSVLSACGHLAALEQGKEIHDYVMRSGFESDIFVGSALVTMYAKCGSIRDAHEVFDKMYQRNLVSWNAMIAGYGMHGHSRDAFTLFYQLQQAGLKPDHITFTSVLSACSHAGLVNEGQQYFNQMSRDYHITPSMEHYTSMVDLLGRAGCLDEALAFIDKMPFEPDACVWGALLSACRIHSNAQLGEFVANRLFDLDPGNTGNYVLLSNIYAVAGRWDDVVKVRKMMKDRGLKLRPGCSWIEMKNRVHSFIVADRSHPQAKKVYTALENFTGQMKAAGYMPDTHIVLHAGLDNMKEIMLCNHGEKLTIAFGVINALPRVPLSMIKNLYACGDCHTATKLISKIVR